MDINDIFFWTRNPWEWVGLILAGILILVGARAVGIRLDRLRALVAIPVGLALAQTCFRVAHLLTFHLYEILRRGLPGFLVDTSFYVAFFLVAVAVLGLSLSLIGKVKGFGAYGLALFGWGGLSFLTRIAPAILMIRYIRDFGLGSMVFPVLSLMLSLIAALLGIVITRSIGQPKPPVINTDDGQNVGDLFH
jgi:hypothetical protein